MGYLLFIAQMLLLLAAIWPPATGWQFSQPVYVWGLLLAGAGIAVWTLLHNRPGNFNPHPEVRQQAKLIQTGPYHWVRHPMYTSLIVGVFGLVLAAPALWWKWLVWLLLVVVLLTKSQIEERLLVGVFPDYPAYQRRTRRLFPWVW